MKRYALSPVSGRHASPLAVEVVKEFLASTCSRYISYRFKSLASQGTFGQFEKDTEGLWAAQDHSPFFLRKVHPPALPPALGPTEQIHSFCLFYSSHHWETLTSRSCLIQVCKHSSSTLILFSCFVFVRGFLLSADSLHILFLECLTPLTTVCSIR